MIVEERDYTIAVGRMPEFIKAYETYGLPVQLRILGKLLGYFTTEIGELNHAVHLWGYDSFDDRDRRRAEMLQDPGFKDYFARIQPMLLSQTTRILKPTGFSPIR